MTEIKTHANVSPDRSHHGDDENQKPKHKMKNENTDWAWEDEINHLIEEIEIDYENLEEEA